MGHKEDWRAQLATWSRVVLFIFCQQTAASHILRDSFVQCILNNALGALLGRQWHLPSLLVYQTGRAVSGHGSSVLVAIRRKGGNGSKGELVGGGLRCMSKSQRVSFLGLFPWVSHRREKGTHTPRRASEAALLEDASILSDLEYFLRRVVEDGEISWRGLN